MNILTNENAVYSMDNVPEFIDDLRFCILDYSDATNVDYRFIPLLFMESFNSPAVDLRIGKHRLTMPIDWSILIGDRHSGDIEILSIKQINDRPFDAFVMNPISGYMPEFLDIEIMNVYPDKLWHFPKVKTGAFISIPLNHTTKPSCAFFIKDIGKVPDTLDITNLV